MSCSGAMESGRVLVRVASAGLVALRPMVESATLRSLLRVRSVPSGRRRLLVPRSAASVLQRSARVPQFSQWGPQRGRRVPTERCPQGRPLTSLSPPSLQYRAGLGVGPESRLLWHHILAEFALFVCGQALRDCLLQPVGWGGRSTVDGCPCADIGRVLQCGAGPASAGSCLL